MKRKAEVMEFHPVANIFPMMAPDEYAGLREDIRKHGLLEPIYVYQKTILDGRNRYKACTELGIEPLFVEWYGQGSPVDFIVSLNLHRRHLNETQRAMVGERLATRPEGRPKTTSIDAVSKAEAAELLNVSESSIDRARVIRKEGDPELIAECEAGETSLNDAVHQITQRKRAQRVLDEFPEDERPESIEELQSQISAQLTTLDRCSQVSKMFHQISQAVLKCRTGLSPDELFEGFDDRRLEWTLQGVDEILSEFQEWRSEILRINPSLKRALRQVN